MPYIPPPELASLSLTEIADLLAVRRLPPVEQWAPVQTLDSHMRIAHDGRWFHHGGEITRPAMIRAFASLLLRDAQGQHWLVTPQDRQKIAVDDAAFIAVDVKADRDDSGQMVLIFRLNTDELVIAGPDHPLTARGSLDAPALYLAVRHGCEARINRSTWISLVEMALADDAPAETDQAPPGVSSLGARFALVSA